jgi:hypothetical protein
VVQFGSTKSEKQGKVMVPDRPFEDNRVTAIEYGLIGAVKAIKYGVIAITILLILGTVRVDPIAVFSEVVRGLAPNRVASS